MNWKFVWVFVSLLIFYLTHIVEYLTGIPIDSPGFVLLMPPILSLAWICLDYFMWEKEEAQKKTNASGSKE